MFVTGITIDALGTKRKEDGFSIKKTDTSYELIVSVVNLAKKVQKYDGFIGSKRRKSLYESNGVDLDEIVFSSEFRDAFLFRIEIDFDGNVLRFTPLIGKFSIRNSYSFGQVIEDDEYKLVKECLSLVDRPARNTNLFLRPEYVVQSINMLVGKCLAEYLLKINKVSAIVSGLGMDSYVIPSLYNVSESNGRLFTLNNNYGVLVEGAFASLVRLRYVRSNYFFSGQSDVGNLCVLIGSPLRSFDALINQLILFSHLTNVVDYTFSKNGDLKVLGPTIHERVQYLDLVSMKIGPVASQAYRDDHFLSELSGKVLKGFVQFLYEHSLSCPQLNSANIFQFCSLSEKAILISYMIYMKRIPDYAVKWIGHQMKGTMNELVHQLNSHGLVSVHKFDDRYSIQVNAKSIFPNQSFKSYHTLFDEMISKYEGKI